MAQRRTGFVRIDISGICVFQSALVLQQGRGDFGKGFVLQQLGGFFQVFLEMRAVAVALVGGVIVVDFKEIPFVRLRFVGGGVNDAHAVFFGDGFAHFCLDDFGERLVGFRFDGDADEVGAGVFILFDFFVAEVLRLDVVFVFVVGEDLRRDFAEFSVLRRLDMRLVGGIIGVDFNHVCHLRVGFLFDGIDGEGSRLFCERGADVFVADLVVGGALAVFYAEFKDVENGRGVGAGGGEGGHEDGGFFHGVSVGFVMGAV